MTDVFVLAGASVDVETLDLFEIVLDVLKDRGGGGIRRIGGHDLWSEVAKRNAQFPRLVVPPQSDSEAKQAAVADLPVKKIMSFVSAVGSSLQEALSYQTSTDGGWGLLSLPDDILATIIEIAALASLRDPRIYRPQTLYLSHVCRKFRNISLHLPRLWTFLECHRHGFDMARLYAERSNHAGLDIELTNATGYSEDDSDGDAEASKRNRFVQAIIPYANEWRSLLYSVPNDPDGRDEFDPGLKLNRLQHLHVYGDPNRPFMQLEMPNLRTIRLRNTVPPQPISSTITQFSVVFGESYKNVDLRTCLVSLSAFLRGTPSIIELGLGFKFYTGPTRVSSLARVTLENVQFFILDIEYKSKEDDNDAPRSLANSFHMPNLSRMDLFVKFESTTPQFTSKSPFVFGLLPDPKLHSKLQSLRLVAIDGRARCISAFKGLGMEITEDLKYNGVLDFEATKAPFLTSLALHTNFELRLSSGGFRFFPLRRLELESCPNLHNDFVRSVHVNLVHDNNWELFEEAVVRDCPNISLSEGSLHMDIGRKVRIAPRPGILESMACGGLHYDFGEIPKD